MLLTLGQGIGIAVGFVIPVFLSRWLPVEDYGTYKQVMLIHTFLLLTVHWGMDWGLFYFIKRNPARAAGYSLNACLVDFVMATLVSALGLAGAEAVGRALNNPALTACLPYFAPFVLFSIPSHHFGHFLVVTDRVKPAVALTIAYEVGKTAIIVGGYYFFRSLPLVLLGLAALSCLRLAVMLGAHAVAFRRGGYSPRATLPSLPEQWRFGLPLGCNNLLTIVLKSDRFFVSSWFGLRAFTFYTTGCFELPVVETAINNLTDLMSFDMVTAAARGDLATVRELWRSTMRKIAALHLPLTVFAVAFADDIIRFLYSDRYAESVPYFRFFSVIFLLGNFVPEVVFRVFARTRIPLAIQSLAVPYTVAAVGAGAWLGGPLGAIAGKLVADAMTCALRLEAIRRLLLVSRRELLPWGEMAAVAALCALTATALRTFVPSWGAHRFAYLAVIFPAYGLASLALLVLAGIVPTNGQLKIRFVRNSGL